MQYTENYKFKKAEYDEFADVGTVNEALDAVDATLYTCEENTKKAVEDLETATGDVAEVAREAAQEVLDSKADLSTTHEISLTAAAWMGTEAPYSIAVPVEGVTATNNIDIIPKASTEAQIEAWQDLGYVLGSQAAGKITLKAWGKKPTTDIPITLIVRGDA